MQKTPMEFWKHQKQYCESLLAQSGSPQETKSLRDEIDYAQQQIDAINNGTYEPPQIMHEVWIVS